MDAKENKRFRGRDDPDRRGSFKNASYSSGRGGRGGIVRPYFPLGPQQKPAFSPERRMTWQCGHAFTRFRQTWPHVSLGVLMPAICHVSVIISVVAYRPEIQNKWYSKLEITVTFLFTFRKPFSRTYEKNGTRDSTGRPWSVCHLKRVNSRIGNHRKKEHAIKENETTEARFDQGQSTQPTTNGRRRA